MMIDWHPHTWQDKNQTQTFDYPLSAHAIKILEILKTYPILTTPAEIDTLKTQLAKASRGECFVVQGGECAETFANCHDASITNMVKVLLQASLIASHQTQMPTVLIGRIAGQYAKPRTELFEKRHGQHLPNYRGDLINHILYSEEARTPNPERMLKAHSYSLMTLNKIKQLVSEGLFDAKNAHSWQPVTQQHNPLLDEYLNCVTNLKNPDRLPKVLYTSHEALHLPYEQAFTRYQNASHRWYNLTTHFPWCGMRTTHVDDAHIHYLSGIANPIALKIGAQMTPDHLDALIKTLNPNHEPGRLTLITRFGHDKIASCLPPLIKLTQKRRTPIVWMCDPMHGNTKTTARGYKTRYMKDILSDLAQTIALHKEHHSQLNGIHFEVASEDVTECVGGQAGILESQLHLGYKTPVDPRLNFAQVLELMFARGQVSP